MSFLIYIHAMRIVIRGARALVAGAWLTTAGVFDGSAARAQRTRADSARSDSAQRLPGIETISTIRPAAAPAIGSTIPARLTLLDAKDGRLGERRSIVSLLERHAGFSVYDDLGSPYKLTMSSRGFAASPVVGTPQGIAVFLDGVRMNEPDAAQVNFDLFPTEHIDHIEILSGNGTLLGRNALGGGVNVVTARGRGAATGGISMSGASFGGRSVDVRVGGPLPRGFDYYVGASANQERGWRQLTGARVDNAMANVDWNRGARGLHVGVLSSTSRAETAGSLPESVFDTRPDSNLSSGDYEDLRQTQVSVSGYAPLGRGKASFVTYARRHHADRFNVNQRDDPDVLGVTASTTTGGTLDYQWARPMGQWGVVHVRAGADGSASRTEIQLYADSTKFGGVRDVTTDVRSPTWDVASYALVDVQRGRFTWSSGVRYDHVAIPFHDRLDPDADTTGTYDQINPRFGVAIDVGRGLTTYASIGKSFRAPALIENACADPARPCPLPYALGDDPPLEPVRATSYEAGAAYASDRWQSSVSMYLTDLRDDIFVTPTPNEAHEGTVHGYFINLAATRRAGLESNARYTFADRGALYVAYSYTRATFQSTAHIASPLEVDGDDENIARRGDRLPLVPSHQIRAGVDSRIAGSLSAGLDGRYVGSQWLRGDEANNHRPLRGYVVVDARASFGWRQWEATAGISNLLGRRYASFGTYNVNEGAPDGPVLERFLSPGAKRSVRVSVQYRFDSSRP
jgi:outer membrane receptor protein involved in Fe transport